MKPLREAAFSLGSNLGDSLKKLREARHRIATRLGVRELALSSIYETSPVDVPEEFLSARYLNALIIVEGALDAEDWHALARELEDRMGRVRDGRRNVPRVIDIDLIYSGSDFVNTARLRVPHPRWQTRKFVLAPLAELRPEAILPGATQTVAQILAGVDSREDVCKTTLTW